MKTALLRLAADFISTIVFLVAYAVTGNIVLATALAVVTAIVQFVRARITGIRLDFMSYASLGLVIVLGGATLLTHDPRFVLAKPSIAHFAIGGVMLHRGWMLRYMPAIVIGTIPEYVTVAGYAWAALMFVLGLGTIACAVSGDMWLWTLYVTVIANVAKAVAFAIQYVTFRLLVRGRLRATAAATS